MAEPTPLSELLGSTSVESVLGSDVLEPEERRPPAWAPREKLSPQEALQMRFRAEARCQEKRVLLRGPRPLGASPLRPIEDLDSPESLPEDNADAEEMEEMLAVPPLPAALVSESAGVPATEEALPYTEADEDDMMEVWMHSDVPPGSILDHCRKDNAEPASVRPSAYTRRSVNRAGERSGGGGSSSSSSSDAATVPNLTGLSSPLSARPPAQPPTSTSPPSPRTMMRTRRNVREVSTSSAGTTVTRLPKVRRKSRENCGAQMSPGSELRVLGKEALVGV